MVRHNVKEATQAAQDASLTWWRSSGCSMLNTFLHASQPRSTTATQQMIASAIASPRLTSIVGLNMTVEMNKIVRRMI